MFPVSLKDQSKMLQENEWNLQVKIHYVPFRLKCMSGCPTTKYKYVISHKISKLQRSMIAQLNVFSRKVMAVSG